MKIRQYPAALALLLLGASCSDSPTSTPSLRDDYGGVKTAQSAADQDPTCQFGGTYPFCWYESAPPPEDPGTPCNQVTQCGGGGAYDPPPSTPGCDPSTDTLCYQPLKQTDKDMLAEATSTWWRPLAQIPNASARAQCSAMRTKFNDLMTSGAVFRGNTDTHESTHPDSLKPHYGAWDYDTSRLHFDPTWLDAAVAGDAVARQEIANTALHESAHALGYDHSEPVGAYYAEAPFNLLSPGTNTCLRW